MERITKMFGGAREGTASGLLPFLLLAGVTIIALILILANGHSLDQQSLYGLLQYFATIGPVALGFGLVMMAGHFDLSVAAMFGFGGIVAVLTGTDAWQLGLAAAVGSGIVSGVILGTIIVKLRMPSLPVTLGGMVTLTGLSYVLTSSKSVSFSNYDIGIKLSEPIAEVFSYRSITALVCFLVAAVVLRYTRLGRDLYAVGGNARAARSAGLKVGAITIGVLAVSGALTALSGGMVAYTLAAAAPDTALNPLVPAAIAAVVGGVATGGGGGTALGIFAGVLTLSVIETTFNILATPDYVSGVVYGSLLLLAMIAAAPERRNLWSWATPGLGSTNGVQPKDTNA